MIIMEQVTEQHKDIYMLMVVQRQLRGLLHGSGSWAVRCKELAEVELRYNDSVKFATTSTGVTVTGALFVNTGDASGNRMGLKGDGATTGTALHTNWTTGNSYLDFRLGGDTDSYTKMRITNTGNVGKYCFAWLVFYI